MLILQIIILLYTIAIIIIGISLLWSEISGIPFVPSKLTDLEIVLTKLKLPKDTKMIDLGSGDGRVVFMAASKFGWDVTGVEINKIFVWYSKIKRLFITSKTRFESANFLKIPLDKYQVIYIYGFPKIISQLIPKLNKECRKGTWIISNTFTLPHKTPTISQGQIRAYKIT